MNTLTYGRKRPDNGDKGSAFWDALRANITLDDAHTHDGLDSPLIPASNLTKGSVAVTNSGWSADGTLYRKLVTCPGDFTFAGSVVRYFLNGGDDGGNEFYPKTLKASGTTFYLYMPVNDQAVDIVFG